MRSASLLAKGMFELFVVQLLQHINRQVFYNRCHRLGLVSETAATGARTRMDNTRQSETTSPSARELPELRDDVSGDGCILQ